MLEQSSGSNIQPTDNTPDGMIENNEPGNDLKQVDPGILNASDEKYIRSVSRFINWIAWLLNEERILGLALIMYGVVAASVGLRDGTPIGFLIEFAQLNPIIVSHWYMLSGVILFVRGANTPFNLFLLCIIPLFLDIIGGVYYARYGLIEGTSVDSGYVVRELIIMTFILRRLLIRLASELIARLSVISHRQ